MRINHNISAMNTYRQLTGNNSATSKSLEKLSSGLKINRAGDNAAGLAISEKMRGQIRGLDQASTNANDGISLIQTAEGALNETHSILQRMRELAVQSSNDTNTDDDRQEIQKEINQLTQEIDRISSDTEFNTQKLLNGDKEITYTSGTALSGNISKVSFDAGVAGGTYNVVIDVTSGNVVSGTGTGGLSGFAALGTTNLAKGSYNLSVDSAKNIATITDVEGRTVETVNLTDSKVIADINLSGNTTTNGTMSFQVTLAKTEKVTVKNLQGDEVKGINVDLTHNAVDVTAGTSGNTLEVDASKAVRFQIGSNTGQGTSLNIGDMGAEKLGVDGLDLTTQAGADFAITTIDKALSQVSSERAKLGAVQNRLEHTINNLGTSSENLTAAESRIRDVDMAKEMMEFTKNNILSQAAQAMLAQANQQPQGVLQLLQ